MNELNNRVEPKSTKQSVNIGKITNVLDSSDLLTVLPPCQHFTKIVTERGLLPKNTNVVKQKHSQNLPLTSQNELESDYSLSPVDIQDETSSQENANGDRLEDDITIQHVSNLNKEAELVEELRHLGKQRMAEMLQTKKKLEERLEQITQQNVPTNVIRSHYNDREMADNSSDTE